MNRPHELAADLTRLLTTAANALATADDIAAHPTLAETAIRRGYIRAAHVAAEWALDWQACDDSGPWAASENLLRALMGQHATAIAATLAAAPIVK